MTIADALNAERERQGLSFAALAELCGLHVPNVHRLCRKPDHDPKVSTLRKVLHALGKDLKWLFNQVG